MTITDDQSTLTLEDLPELLKDDDNVKVAGTDIDGIFRGKVMAKNKFCSVAGQGFGFCGVLFNWDMHDVSYPADLDLPDKNPSFRDLVARIDLASFRRIPWEGNIPFFLVSFNDVEGHDWSICPRTLLRKASDAVEKVGITAKAGAEYEFFTFKVPDGTPVARYVRDRPPKQLPHLTEGMFGYSISRPMANQDWYYEIVKTCRQLRCPLEGWHCESGPGVYEAASGSQSGHQALEYDEIKAMADKAALFKHTVKSVSHKYGITPCFMAKPRADLPGNSGHIHISLTDSKSGKNLLARDEPDISPQYPDLEWVSDIGRHFLAGVIEGLPDVMPIFAPTINSYKRLVENVFAPTTISWALEHREASIRIIAPPAASPKSTRLEVRVPGADTNPYLVLAAILALGWRGVEKKLEIKVEPSSRSTSMKQDNRLARNLGAALDRFRAKSSIAREVLGDKFVDHFAATRENELRLYERAVTDWVVFSLLIINKAGGLVYNRTFSPGLQKISSNEALVLAGTFHGIHAISKSLAPPSTLPSNTPQSSNPNTIPTGPVRRAQATGIQSLESSHFRLTCFQTATGVKFLLFTSPEQPNADVVVRRCYEIYGDQVMKNPFYGIEMPVRVDKFDRALDAYLVRP